MLVRKVVARDLYGADVRARIPYYTHATIVRTCATELHYGMKTRDGTSGDPYEHVPAMRSDLLAPNHIHFGNPQILVEIPRVGAYMGYELVEVDEPVPEAGSVHDVALGEVGSMPAKKV